METASAPHTFARPAADGSGERAARLRRWMRVSCTVIEILVVETIVCGIAAIPSVALWMQLAASTRDSPGLRVALTALFAVPSYVLFALILMACSAAATWITRARTAPDVELRLHDLDWPLLRWVRYMVATHIVRALAGWLFRGSPVWTTYLRLNGARIGRGVYVNTLAITDHNLLELGDGVIIGDAVHISGHTLERGVVKTGRVVLASCVMVGLGSVIGIGVVAETGCQIGALSFVPKNAHLEAGATYAGVPARKLGV